MIVEYRWTSVSRDGCHVTVFLVDRSTGQIRALSLFDFGRAIADGATAGYFVCYSPSAAACQQRAVFRDGLSISLVRETQTVQS